MNTYNKLFTSIISLLLVNGFILSQTISGSAHDFSSETWNPRGEICITCHIPHKADMTVTNSPLWNHQVTSSTFTPYSSLTLDATVGQPSGVSKLCLSCHDGTVAIDNFSGKTNGSTYTSGNDKLGTDLSNDHPVSFTYDASLASTDGDLYDPTSANSGLGGTINDDMLVSGKLECSSCHDVHNG
ncbi:MAG: cytochrome C, partial [FCB group bacterium]|nr:cytochrome C [FCB group bacterium]